MKQEKGHSTCKLIDVASCKRGKENVILTGKQIVYFFKKMQIESTDFSYKKLKTGALLIESQNGLALKKL